MPSASNVPEQELRSGSCRSAVTWPETSEVPFGAPDRSTWSSGLVMPNSEPSGSSEEHSSVVGPEKSQPCTSRTAWSRLTVETCGRFADGEVAALTPGVGKTRKRLIVPYSPDSIHCPSGEIAAQELFSASPAPSVWTYSDQLPSGAWTRYIFALPESAWYGSTTWPS